jgi:hypothetical protein
VTGDGALSLILTTFNQRQQKKIKSA